MPFGKSFIPFSLQLWGNCWKTWALYNWYGNELRRRKTEFKPAFLENWLCILWVNIYSSESAFRDSNANWIFSHFFKLNIDPLILNEKKSTWFYQHFSFGAPQAPINKPSPSKQVLHESKDPWDQAIYCWYHTKKNFFLSKAKRPNLDC